jgi:hypothetical protein
MQTKTDKRRCRKSWDIFICHATEDKEEVARPLADALTIRGFHVWYDEFSLTLGDSLREKIDHGLAKSRFGIVVLSPNFFAKEWPKKELDALVGREVLSKKKIILPIWHNVNYKTVSKFSPILADKIAASTSKGIDMVIESVIKAISGDIERSKFFDEKFVNLEFKITFSSKLDRLVNLLEGGKYDREIEDLVDIIIMEFKERIDKWDSPSTKFATKELFTRLYKYSEKKGFCELYVIFKDLFAYAHSQRKRLLGLMIETLGLLMFSCWVPLYDVEQGEIAAKLMLRLGIDFLDKDVTISEDCITAIDNLAADMFEPEILSKEILLCASAHQKSGGNPELKEFVEQYTDWIRINNEYSWDAEIKTYLRDSIEYAEWEQEKYQIDIKPLKDEFLLPALDATIDGEILEYAQFLEELLNEGGSGTEDTFPAEELAKLILAYEFQRPKFAYEVKEEIIKTGKQPIIELFRRIVDSSNFLKKIYEGSEMISTFDELIKFLDQSSDLENIGVGVTAYSLAIIDFQKRIKQNEKEALKELAKKYGIQDELEISDEGIQFEIDHLVYLGNAKHDMKKLIEFLKEVNTCFKVKSFSTGITFDLREK